MTRRLPISFLPLPAVVGVFLLVISVSCKDSGITPPDNKPDTTSHSFTWDVDALGDASSVLHDVAIINDTLAYAVGEIYLNDSTGQINPVAYSYARWNGSKWNLTSYSYWLYNSDCTVAGSYYGTSRAVFSISLAALLFTDGVDVILCNGNTFTHLPCAYTSLNGGTRKLWGRSTNDVYAVGNLGAVAHFDGVSWTKLESGTTIDLTDVWGRPDGNVVWACGYSSDYSKSCLLRYENGIWSTLWSRQSTSTPPYGDLVLCLWAGKKFLYVGAADGVYRTALDGAGAAEKVLSLPAVPHGIRGSADNNIAVACDDASIWHYNGQSWLQLQPGELLKPLYSIAVSNNLILAVGFDASTINWKGRILVGRRN